MAQEVERVCDCGGKLTYFRAAYPNSRDKPIWGISVRHISRDGKRIDLDHYEGYVDLWSGDTDIMVNAFVTACHKGRTEGRSRTIVARRRPCECGGTIQGVSNRYRDMTSIVHADQTGNSTTWKGPRATDAAWLFAAMESWADDQHAKQTEDVPKGPNVNGDAIKGKSVCVTGKLAGYTRDTADAAIRLAGGYPSPRVTSATDLLVVGDAPGLTKQNDARKYGVATRPGEWLVEVFRANVEAGNRALRQERDKETQQRIDRREADLKRQREEAAKKRADAADRDRDRGKRSLSRRMSLALDYLSQGGRAIGINGKSRTVDIKSDRYDLVEVEAGVEIRLRESKMVVAAIADQMIARFFGISAASLNGPSADTRVEIKTDDAIDPIMRVKVAGDRVDMLTPENIKAATGKGQIATAPTKWRVDENGWTIDSDATGKDFDPPAKTPERPAPPQRERREKREGRGDW